MRIKRSRVVLVAALALLTGTLAGIALSLEGRPGCGEEFDRAGWRSARVDGERRIELAEQVVRCDLFDGRTRLEVERELGRARITRGHLESEPGSAHAAYQVALVNDHYGPGHSQDLLVKYDRRWRVVQTELSPPGD